MSRETKEEKCDLIAQFLKQNEECALCSREDIAFVINQNWLDGKNYQDIIQAHQNEYKLLSGHDLSPTTLAIHFTKHMNSRGAAINKWSRASGQRQACKTLPVRKDNDLYDLHNRTHLNKFTAADSAVREMIANLDAMRGDIEERRESGRTFDLSLAMKEYGKLLQGLHASLLKSQEIDSKLEVNASNIQTSRVLEFIALGGKADHPGHDDFVCEAEQLWLATAVKHIVARLDSALKSTGLDAPSKADVLVHVKEVMKGLDESVSSDYEIAVTTLRDRHFGSVDIVEGVIEQKEASQ